LVANVVLALADAVDSKLVACSDEEQPDRNAVSGDIEY
jgi:hypothetical protein